MMMKYQCGKCLKAFPEGTSYYPQMRCADCTAKGFSPGITGPREVSKPFLRLDVLPDCDCGACVVKLPHSSWCSLQKRLDSDAAAAKMK